MFFHIFKYQIKVFLKEKQGLFWTLVFPIILSTLFTLVFANISEGEMFKNIPIALVNSTDAQPEFIEAMENTELFEMQKTNKADAADLLSRGKISGIITFNEEPELVVHSSGMNESVIKAFMDSYVQTMSTVTNVARINPQGISDAFFEVLESNNEYTLEKPISSSNNYVVIYFYALLSMTCLMTATYGCVAVSSIQANQTQLAARINVAPAHKMKMFLASISATFVYQFATILIVLFYMRLILNTNFGASMVLVVLLCFVGCVTGISFGTTISALVAKSENIKMAIIVSITMFGCFLAGLMSVDIKYIVQTNFPIAAYLNPANLIADGFYCLYYYDTYERFFINLGILALLSVVFCTITYTVLRRQKYASI